MLILIWTFLSFLYICSLTFVFFPFLISFSSNMRCVHCSIYLFWRSQVLAVACMWGPHCCLWDLSLWPSNSLVEAHRLWNKQTHQLLHMDSLVVAQGLSCSKTCGILVPQPGLKTKSPALQGRFLTTGQPRKL